jgi:glycosyltransferase involved in cell wall biosynthesis
MTKISVSIIVPVYNAQLYLEKCVTSLMSLTLKNIEIILVNDGSTDTSGELCDHFATLDTRITVIHQKNGGQTKARIAGLKASKGEYVHFVDSDDWLDPTMEEIMHTQAAANNADIVTCDSIFHKGTKEIPARQPFEAGVYTKERLIKDLYPRLIYSGRFFYFGIYAAMWNKLFRRSLVTRHIESLDPAVRIGEDGLTTFPSFLEANTVVVVKDLLYQYRDDNTTSLTRSYVKEQFDSALLLIKYLREIATKYSKHVDLTPQIDAYLAYNVRSIILEEFYYKVKKSLKSRLRYIRRIMTHPEVQEAIQRLDTSQGYTAEQARFISYIRSQDFIKLIVATITRSADQRLRLSIRQFAYKNARNAKLFQSLKAAVKPLKHR